MSTITTFDPHAGLDINDGEAGRETGAASAEYAAVTACGVGLAGVLMKLLTSDFGQNLLEKLLVFVLGMVVIG